VTDPDPETDPDPVVDPDPDPAMEPGPGGDPDPTFPGGAENVRPSPSVGIPTTQSRANSLVQEDGCQGAGHTPTPLWPAALSLVLVGLLARRRRET
jgi:MYXO-CTERM domain-containing protein